jgi:hypothetical protein
MFGISFAVKVFRTVVSEAVGGREATVGRGLRALERYYLTKTMATNSNRPPQGIYRTK